MAGIGIYGALAIVELAGSAYYGYRQLTKQSTINTQGPRVTDFTMQSASYGNPLIKAYGRMRVAGNVIWMQPILETPTTTAVGAGKGGGGVKQTTTNYSYSATLAIALCQGPIDSILQVWADSELLTDQMLGSMGTNYNIYYGNDTQLPDPIIESFEGVGQVPAYRDVAYVVIQDFPLANYGNRIPNFTFEVNRVVRQSPALEDKITAVNLIPGAGEAVYDTVVQKYVNTLTGVASNPENMNTSTNNADIITALDQLQATLPNVQWIGLVVCWFATSTDAGTCTIIPKVEVQGSVSSSPDDWSVAGLDRSTAQAILRFSDGTPTYGGTPSDISIIRLVQEIKSRGLNIMFYPMVFVDTITPDPKPWRGRITPANATDAASWFTKTNGYNDFINHYLTLNVNGMALANYIDAFVIGSEYVGMTSFSDIAGSYPAVTGFINVAAAAKAALPANVKTIYAGDWSEYHHASGGWYNMDPLWADSNLDLVGIDAYFPLTPDLAQSDITYQTVYDGWTSGEGWDYYWDSTRTIKTNFSGFAYAWKNVGYWWSNLHTNPDNSITAWTPKMKPLWFTEFGFPSVDGCSNQPNVFVDPRSSESSYPRASKQNIDFAAQRLALEATEDFLTAQNAVSGNSNLVPSRFVWTWDARPYPQYPNLSSVWADSDLWVTGHWIEGKIGTSTVGAIVGSLVEEVGVTNYDVSTIQDSLDGYCIPDITDIRTCITGLNVPYFFDMVESSGVLKFVKRGQNSSVTIPQDNIVPPTSKNDDIRTIAKIIRTQEVDLPQKYSVTYYDQANNYEQNTQIAQRQTTQSVNQVNLTWNLSIDDQTAQNIANQLLYTAWMNRTIYQFTVPPIYATIEPTDVITVTIDNVDRVLRVTSSDMKPNGSQDIQAVTENISTYNFYQVPGTGITAQQLPTVIPVTALTLLDLPAFPSDAWTDIFMTVADIPLDPNWNGAVLYRSDDGGVNGGNTYVQVVPLTVKSTIGTATSVLGVGNYDTWDNASSVTIVMQNGSLSSATQLALLNGANSAVLGSEIIQFQNAELVGTNTYLLSGLLRGRLGTEDQVASHVSGESFVLLDSTISRVTMPISLINILDYYKCVSVGATLAVSTEQSFTYNARQLKPHSPVQITGSRDGSGNLTINWVRRTRVGGALMDGTDVPLSEESEAYQVDIYSGSNVVRTVASTSPTCSYPAAEQITDFGSMQNAVNVRVYQMSATVGRGIAGSGVV